MNYFALTKIHKKHLILKKSEPGQSELGNFGAWELVLRYPQNMGEFQFETDVSDLD